MQFFVEVAIEVNIENGLKICLHEMHQFIILDHAFTLL